jgi:superfamily I DNA/RNA helicase
MQCTEEQRAIIESDAPILKINAVAGSGKTTTLLEYAARRRDKRILYLVYNKSVADEVRAKLLARSLDHVRVYTIHGLAYRYANGGRYELESELSEWRILDRYVSAEDRQSKDALLLGWLIKDLTNYYLNAAHTGFDDELLEFYAADSAPKPKIRALLDRKGDELLGIVRHILSDMRDQTIPAVHDFYLKLFQFCRERLPYDIILVDEAQDTSGVMLSIVDRQPAQKVFVGDTFQQIYAFRYAINSLDRVQGESLWLSRSFRFGNGLAKHIEEKVNDAYRILGDDKMIRIQGNPADTAFGKQAPDAPRPLAIIARSNLRLFEACLSRLFEGNGLFFFEGGYQSYSFLNARVVSVFYLREGKRDKITDPLVRRFQSVSELKEFAIETQNNALLTVIELVERYGAKLFEFDRLIKERLGDKDEAEFTFTTTHKAKGREYDHVEMLDEDFLTRGDLRKAVEKCGEELQLSKLCEEINIFYVAATRARKSIRLAAF